MKKKNHIIRWYYIARKQYEVEGRGQNVLNKENHILIRQFQILKS